MKFIPEDVVDQVVENISSDTTPIETITEQFGMEQPHLLAYLLQEDFELLTDEEQEYMIYLIRVIWLSVDAVYDELPIVETNLISKLEEKNWATLKEVRAKKFSERINVFFEEYQQEDLLAFVEDALVYDEEDNIISNEGREYLFVSLKTIIDAFHQTIKE